MREPFQTDVPSASDELKRRPFAERVASTLETLDVKASLVIGIHATMGDGKTTVLRYIAEALANEPAVTCLEFNPLLFEAAAEMPRLLLATLSDSLATLMPTEAADIRSVFQNYAKFFGEPEHETAGAARPAPEQRSTVHLAAAKAAVDRILSDSGQRIVVLVDDADQLEAVRLLALFKLLKMTADFSATTSVIYL